MTFYINQLCLIFFNCLNAFLDAHRILKKKSIAHGLNFGAYAAFVLLLSVLFEIHKWELFLFCCSAFFNRQLSFDITLNLRRGLSWSYQSVADPPKAVMDKIERFVFSDCSGDVIALFYFNAWLDILVVYNCVYI